MMVSIPNVFVLFVLLVTGPFVCTGCDSGGESDQNSGTETDLDSDTSDSDTDTGLESSCEGPERTIVIGDIHGDVAAAREALQIGGVIDEDANWIGGPTTVIQLGDILDRGPNERELVDFLTGLKEFTVNNDCGEFNMLVGNHEILTVGGEYGYLDEMSCEGFADIEDLDLEQPELAGLSDSCKKRGAAFLPGGPYAQILATWPVSLIRDDIIYVHGGLIPVHIDYGLDVTNEEVSQWLLGNQEAPPGTVAYNANSMVWNRTYSEDEPSEQECEILQGIFDEVGVSHMVVGHSIQDVINPACNEMVWRVDIGMSAFYGGATQVLQIQDGQFTVLENLN